MWWCDIIELCLCFWAEEWSHQISMASITAIPQEKARLVCCKLAADSSTVKPLTIMCRYGPAYNEICEFHTGIHDCLKKKKKLYVNNKTEEWPMKIMPRRRGKRIGELKRMAKETLECRRNSAPASCRHWRKFLPYSLIFLILVILWFCSLLSRRLVQSLSCPFRFVNLDRAATQPPLWSSRLTTVERTFMFILKLFYWSISKITSNFGVCFEIVRIREVIVSSHPGVN